MFSIKWKGNNGNGLQDHSDFTIVTECIRMDSRNLYQIEMKLPFKTRKDLSLNL